MQSESTAEKKDLIPVRFHFYKLTFTPYNHIGRENTHSIIHKVVTFLNQEQQAGKGILIDKHEDRGNESARPLFVTNAVLMLKERRIRLSMALLRTGRIPMVKPTDKFLLIPFDSSNGEIAEQTHFFIDYNTDSIVYDGPRKRGRYLRVIFSS